MTPNLAKIVLLAYPAFEMAQVIPDSSSLGPITQGGAFIALVYVIWWLLNKYLPAQEQTHLAAIQLLTSASEKQRTEHVKDLSETRTTFASESAALRRLFAEESVANRKTFEDQMHHYRHEGKGRENGLMLNMAIKDQQMIAVLSGQKIPSAIPESKDVQKEPK